MSDEKKQEEKKVSFFDPVINAFREIPVSLAIKYVKHLEGLKKQLENNQ